MAIAFSVSDSGPVQKDGPYERRIEFRSPRDLSTGRVLIITRRMSTLELEHARDGADFLRWWNEGFILEAFKAYYEKIAGERLEHA